LNQLALSKWAPMTSKQAEFTYLQKLYASNLRKIKKAEERNVHKMIKMQVSKEKASWKRSNQANVRETTPKRA